MTESQFIAIHLATSNNINFPTNVNINYDETSPGIGTVTGFTVTTEALAGSTQVDLQSELQQVTNVSLTLNGILFNFIVINVQQYILPTPAHSFYYFKVQPTQTFTISTIVTPVQAVPVNFTPFGSVIQFLNSDYNVLFSNATEQRTSTIIEQSDRANTNTIPTNFAALLVNSASKAHVQDSNYTDSGWIGARYEGTKTAANTYGGVSPAVSAKYFTGEIYRSGSLSNTICSQSLSARVLKQLVHTGKSDLPLATVSSTNYALDASVDILTNTLQYHQTTNASASIDYGNIIVVDNEKMRVIGKQDPNLIVVQRGYVGTTPATHANNTPINMVNPIQIIDIDQASTVRTLPIIDSKIWVQDSESVIFTDDYGVVYDSYSCTP